MNSNKNSKRRGMSSIVFAIAFVTILSLLSVGFATIARRDTNEVLDRTLSYQAQYAAESGINYAIKKIKDNPTTSQSTCNTPINLSAGVDITCVTWGPADDNNVVLSSIKEYPKNIKLQSDDVSKSINKINIEWSYADAVTGTIGGIKPSIDGKNILKIALASPDAPSPTNYLMYANAINSPGNTNTTKNLQDGDSFDVNCTGDSCSLDITGLGGNTWLLALSSLGKDVNRATITALDATNNPVTLKDIQIEIDSNAIANGVTKRLLARIPIESSSWIPANAVTANRICKDIRIDGTNNTNISGYAYPNAPLNPTTGPLIGCPNGSAPTGSIGSAEVYSSGNPPPSGSNDDASVQTPPPSNIGNGVNNPEWFLWYSMGSSTIPDGQRATCTYELLYSRNNINPALMQVASGLRNASGADCNDYKVGSPTSGIYVTFKPGIDGDGSRAWQQCDIDLLINCNTSGYYNVRMYVVANDGRRVGPRYKMNYNNTTWENSCRPLEINASGDQVCTHRP
jgi:Tfp pilus assembly protein PilX